MSKSTKWVLAGSFGAFCLVSAFIGLGVTSVFYRPDFSQMNKKVQLTVKKADRTKTTKWFGPETPDWVPMSGISDYAIAAVISSEDTSFYSHQGVDYHELKEAIKKDLKEKKWARGASTLTQQVVKNVYLTQEKTITRKFREILWAGELEKSLTKSQILCFYLNMAEWAPGIYGIKGAAQHYFQKSPAELSAKESAFLAMLLPSPWRYHIYYVKKEITPWAQKRIERILTVMNKMGYLDETEYQGALAENLWGGLKVTGSAEEGASDGEAPPDKNAAPSAPAPAPAVPGDKVDPADVAERPGPASMDEEPTAEDPDIK